MGDSFTHVDPFEDTESKPPSSAAAHSLRFTHVDPFEDTESGERTREINDFPRFTHVDPFEDTESCCPHGDVIYD